LSIAEAARAEKKTSAAAEAGRAARDTVMTRDIKSDPEEFAKLESGEQTFLMRLNENYANGDMLTVREFDPRRAHETGRTLMFNVKSIESGEKNPAILSPRYVIMSVEPIGAAEQGQRGHSRGAGEL
jgi:Domain of unknown function (DUF3850)